LLKLTHYCYTYGDSYWSNKAPAHIPVDPERWMLLTHHHLYIMAEVIDTFGEKGNIQ